MRRFVAATIVVTLVFYLNEVRGLSHDEPASAGLLPFAPRFSVGSGKPYALLPSRLQPASRPIGL